MTGDPSAPPTPVFARSAAMLERMRQYDALADVRPSLFFTGGERIGGYPLFVDRAKGAHLWDIDGNRFTDFLLGYGSVVLGHADEAVTRSVVEALTLGANPTLLNRWHCRLVERLAEMLPNADQFVLLRTGSDAMSAAVRLARVVTGRPVILQWGMHGWHDWCATHAGGVLDANRDHAVALRYNDLAWAEQLFDRYRDRVAAVVMMPYELDMPEDGFLHRLRDLAHRNGALFVLDEVRSGFRIAAGGAQQHFDIAADLAAYSKALANGHAISVLAGRYDYMQQVEKLGLTITFYRSPEATAAALATVEQIVAHDTPARLAVLGLQLCQRIDAGMAAAGLPGGMIGHPATPMLRFGFADEQNNRKAISWFSNAMLEQGHIMPHAHHWFICGAMTEQDMDSVGDAAEHALDRIAARLS